jgi:signal peptidase I
MQHKIRRFVREQRGFILFVLAILVFRSAVADWNDVPSGSMLPTIREGDRLYVDKLAYDLRLPFTHVSLHRIAEPQRGDVVVFESEHAGKRLVKRVIGLPGDVVAMRNDVLYLNGERIAHTPLGHSPDQGASDWQEHLQGHPHAVRLLDSGGSLDSFGPVRVPEAHLLVLGDNRDNSADSRVHGFVPRHEIVGRAERVLFSLDYDRWLLPRSERVWHRLDASL